MYHLHLTSSIEVKFDFVNLLNLGNYKNISKLNVLRRSIIEYPFQILQALNCRSVINY